MSASTFQVTEDKERDEPWVPPTIIQFASTVTVDNKQLINISQLYLFIFVYMYVCACVLARMGAQVCMHVAAQHDLLRQGLSLESWAGQFIPSQLALGVPISSS